MSWNQRFWNQMKPTRSLSFTQKGDLKTHIESVHGGITFKCDICPSNFTHKGNLKTHIESVHGGKNSTFKFFHQTLQNKAA